MAEREAGGEADETHDLVRLHVAATLGLILAERRQIAPDLWWARSAALDTGWNFGFAPGGRALTLAEADAVAAVACTDGRQPVVLQAVDAQPLAGWQVAEAETWMWVDASSGVPAGEAPGAARAQIVGTPTPEMVDVFDDVYVAAAAPGGIGYAELAPSYSAGYRLGLATPPAEALHVAVSVDGRCAAIATVCVVERVAGLYFVGTHRDFRRQGLGAYATVVACNEAFRRGAEGVFLQTIPDSPVEAMYATLGFRRRFVALYLAPAETS